MICCNCGHDNDMVRIGFKSICGNCSAYLHSCVHCSLLDRFTMTCRSHTTELVSDRTGNNYCEEFIPLADDGSRSESARDNAARDRFDGLFSDD